MEKYASFEEYKQLLSSQGPAEGPPQPYVYSVYGGILLPTSTAKVVEDLKTWEVRDDVWVITYPKAGTTWTQEIVSCLMHDGNLEEVNKRHTTFRVPYIDQSLPEPMRKLKNIPETHRIAEEMPSPRVIKSHLPGQLLPPQIWEKKPKIVYVIRNPKDLTVSLFYFVKMYDPSKVDQTFGEFLDDMYEGKVPYGVWWDHYLYLWRRRNDKNMVILRFEDIKRDLGGKIEKLSKFLGKNLSPETLDAVAEHCIFANMKKNPMTDVGIFFVQEKKGDKPSLPFMRKGQVGNWKFHFTVAQNEAFDAFIEEKLRGTGLTFEYCGET